MALFTKDTTPQKPQQPRGGEGQMFPAGTFFGPEINIEGTITGGEPVTIEGVVRGDINLSSDLRIGPKARVEATVHAHTVTVEGKLFGDVTADARIELVTTATVDGNLKAPKIIVSEGAQFRGSVDMGSPRPKEAVKPNHAPHNDQAPAKAR